MIQEEAQTVALRALAFIAEDPDRLARFLALSGCGPADLRERIGDPAFLGGVLDFLMGHEPDLIAYAEWAELDPETPGMARQLLP